MQFFLFTGRGFEQFIGTRVPIGLHGPHSKNDRSRFVGANQKQEKLFKKGAKKSPRL